MQSLRSSLRTRLILLLAACTVAAAAVVGFEGHHRLRAALQERTTEQLRGVRSDRATQLERWFDRLLRETRWLAGSPGVAEAAEELLGGFAAAGSSGPPEQEQERRLADWYAAEVAPRLDAAGVPEAAAPPTSPVAVRLQARYLAANPHPVGRKDRLAAPAPSGDEPPGLLAYDAAHRRHHPRLAELRRLFGFYDLFLVDPAGLGVAYSVFKESDFATSLADGPHAGSGLAEAVRAALELPAGEVAVTDFGRYAPSFGAPAAFLATRVPAPPESASGGASGGGGGALAVLAAQVPLDRITQITTGGGNWRRVGLGETGEVYLVGPDRLMRSDARAVVEDPAHAPVDGRPPDAAEDRIVSPAAHATSVLTARVGTEAVEAALAGETGTIRAPGPHGRPVYAAYAPLELPGLDWSILAEIEVAEAEAPVRSLWRVEALTVALACLLAVLLGAWAASRALRPLRRLAEATESVARGDLGTRVDEGPADEIGVLARRFNAMVGSLEVAQREVAEKTRENEKLLLNVLPGKIATRLRGGEEMIADRCERVTVVFADIVGFTQLAAGTPPEKLIGVLNELFTRFDEVAAAHGVEKIKTIGDGYMAACGIPDAVEQHCEQAFRFAVGIFRVLAGFNAERGTDLRMRVGMAEGPVVAGVIGSSKFIYDLWGDTVNTAARMESHGVPGAIQADAEVFRVLGVRHRFEDRGEIQVKGKGPMRAYLHRPAVDPLPTAGGLTTPKPPAT